MGADIMDYERLGEAFAEADVVAEGVHLYIEGNGGQLVEACFANSHHIGARCERVEKLPLLRAGIQGVPGVYAHAIYIARGHGVAGIAIDDRIVLQDVGVGIGNAKDGGAHGTGS